MRPDQESEPAVGEFATGTTQNPGIFIVVFFEGNDMAHAIGKGRPAFAEARFMIILFLPFTTEGNTRSGEPVSPGCFDMARGAVIRLPGRNSGARERQTVAVENADIYGTGTTVVPLDMAGVAFSFNVFMNRRGTGIKLGFCALAGKNVRAPAPGTQLHRVAVGKFRGSCTGGSNDILVQIPELMKQVHGFVLFAAVGIGRKSLPDAVPGPAVEVARARPVFPAVFFIGGRHAAANAKSFRRDADPDILTVKCFGPFPDGLQHIGQFAGQVINRERIAGNIRPVVRQGIVTVNRVQQPAVNGIFDPVVSLNRVGWIVYPGNRPILSAGIQVKTFVGFFGSIFKRIGPHRCRGVGVVRSRNRVVGSNRGGNDNINVRGIHSGGMGIGIALIAVNPHPQPVRIRW